MRLERRDCLNLRGEREQRECRLMWVLQWGELLNHVIDDENDMLLTRWE